MTLSKDARRLVEAALQILEACACGKTTNDLETPDAATAVTAIGLEQSPGTEDTIQVKATEPPRRDADHRVPAASDGQ
jgi:hypothetical protein